MSDVAIPSILNGSAFIETVTVLDKYEHHFGALPDWLEDLPRGQKISLVNYALNRGVPLVAADIVH